MYPNRQKLQIRRRAAPRCLSRGGFYLVPGQVLRFFHGPRSRPDAYGSQPAATYLDKSEICNLWGRSLKPLELLTIEDAAQVLKPHDGKPFVDDIRFFDGRHDIRAIWPYRIESAVRAIAAVEYKDKRRNSGGEIPGANASAHDYCEAAPAVAVLRRRDGRIRLEHRLGHVVVEHHPAVLDARTEVSHEDAVLHYLHIVASHFGI